MVVYMMIHVTTTMMLRSCSYVCPLSYKSFSLYQHAGISDSGKECSAEGVAFSPLKQSSVHPQLKNENLDPFSQGSRRLPYMDQMHAPTFWYARH